MMLYFGGKRMTKRLTIALVALVALLLVVLPASATTFYSVNSSLNGLGATVLVGEQQLNITAVTDLVGEGTTIGHWASGNDLYTTAPSYTTVLNSPTSFNIDKGVFYGSSGECLGLWYSVNATGIGINTTVGSPVFNVKDPIVSMDAWDIDTAQVVTGKSVIQGDNLTFRISNTNLNEVYSGRSVDAGKTFLGNVDIRLKSDSGNTYASVISFAGTALPITNQTVNLSTWYFGLNGNVASGTVLGQWYTGATDAVTNQNVYPAGVYTVYAESRVNGMKDFYQSSSGGDYTGKTVSATGTVTIASNTVKIEANKDSVVRSKQFSITVTGRPNTNYHVWLKGVSTLDNTYDNQPPMIAENQVGVWMDTTTAAATLYATANDGNDGVAGGYAAGYQYQNNGSVWNLYRYIGGGDGTGAAATLPAFRGKLYANITLNDAGTRTILFTTTNYTKAQKYTIRVEQNFGGQYKSDEVDVKVEKGAVTIVAAGDQSYYLGEEIKFSGTNTESEVTYLFICGPNLPEEGGSFMSLDPRNLAVDNSTQANIDATFQTADVLGDNTWSWKWGTASVALDAGTYTVYAVSIPVDAKHLNNAAYGTVSIIIKKPFISATASQSTVAKGDSVYIIGTAQGQPSQGVRIWILGKNYAGTATESVNSDASFSYELKKEATADLYAGQYFIVAQHPMQNDQFDVYPAQAAGNGAASGMPITVSGIQVYTVDQTVGAASIDDSTQFKLTGSGSLQGSDAAEALIEAINDANVDDTYTKLQILIEEPTITIDTVGDRHVGDKFTITATTNLAVDDEVLFEVYSSSFNPTTKSQSGEFSGASGTVKVTKGDGGLNKLSFDVDASTFKPDEYLVKASAVLQDATGTSLFNVLEASAATATPTSVVTSAPVSTTVATAVPTTVATPTKTPTQPGFGALVALIGLGAVALLVVRRH
jgi:PGF-CTERM protein